jgi:hypothetical protein
MRDIKKRYYMEEKPKVQRAITEFKQSMGNEGMCMRLESLHEQRLLNVFTISRLVSEIPKQFNNPWSIWRDIPETIAQLQRDNVKIGHALQGVIAEYNGEHTGITDEMVSRAKEYPIGEIIEVNRWGKALCPNHEDTRPSLSIKWNRAKCFVCGWKGDAIAVYMAVHGVGFKRAVKEMA